MSYRQHFHCSLTAGDSDAVPPIQSPVVGRRLLFWGVLLALLMLTNCAVPLR
jgi:hypothetical protein